MAVRRTFYTPSSRIQHMSITHSGPDVFVSQPFLNRPDADSLFEKVGCQSSGGRATGSAIPSGINGGPSYINTKYAYYRKNANPLWELSVGLSLKNFYFLSFSLVF